MLVPEMKEARRMEEMINENNALLLSGTKPRYMVSSGNIAAPFVSAEHAIKWHNHMMDVGIQTHIIDLTDYDWESNPTKFKMYHLSDFYNDLVGRIH